MDGVIESIFNFVQYTLCMHYILYIRFTKKKSRLIIAIVLLALSLFCEKMQLLGQNQIILWMFLVATASMLTFDEKPYQTLLKFSFVFWGLSFIEIPIETALTIIQRYTDIMWFSTYAAWIEETLSIVTLILIIVYIKKSITWQTLIPELSIGIYVIGLFLSFCASAFHRFVFIYGAQMPIHVRTFFEIVCICFSEFIALFGIGLFVMRNLKEQYRKETSLKTEYMTVSRQYYQSLLEKIEETRKLRHDMKAHLSLLNTLLEKDSIDQAKSYLSEITEQVVHTEIAMVNVGNELVNAILSTEKMKLPKDVTFHCEGRLSPEITTKLSDFELCVIFTNLVSNARDACEQLQFHEKEIFLQIRQNQGRLVIQTENPVEWEIDSDRIMQKNMRSQVTNDKAISRYTTKKYAEDHGYGLRNVREIVERHHGRFQFEVKEDRVIVSVLL